MSAERDYIAALWARIAELEEHVARSRNALLWASAGADFWPGGRMRAEWERRVPHVADEAANLLRGYGVPWWEKRNAEAIQR